MFEADVELGAGVTSGDVPHFSFGVATELGGDFFWRVNLDREIIPGIEDFDEEGEALAAEVFSEDFLTMV